VVAQSYAHTSVELSWEKPWRTIPSVAVYPQEVSHFPVAELTHWSYLDLVYAPAV